MIPTRAEKRMSRRTATNPAPRKRQSRPAGPTRASKNCSKTRTRGVTVSREATPSDGWRGRTTPLETLSRQRIALWHRVPGEGSDNPRHLRVARDGIVRADPLPRVHVLPDVETVASHR